MRSKKGVENSFESPDSINAIDWDLKTKNKKIVDYVKSLINLRKEHPVFRMKSGVDIKDNIRFLENLSQDVIGYTINGVPSGDSWKKVLVLFNGSQGRRTLNLPDGKWQYAIWDNEFTSNGMDGQTIFLEPFSCSILFQAK